MCWLEITVVRCFTEKSRRPMKIDFIGSSVKRRRRRNLNTTAPMRESSRHEGKNRGTKPLPQLSVDFTRFEESRVSAERTVRRNRVQITVRRLESRWNMGQSFGADEREILRRDFRVSRFLFVCLLAPSLRPPTNSSFIISETRSGGGEGKKTTGVRTVERVSRIVEIEDHGRIRTGISRDSLRVVGRMLFSLRRTFIAAVYLDRVLELTFLSKRSRLRPARSFDLRGSSVFRPRYWDIVPSCAIIAPSNRSFRFTSSSQIRKASSTSNNRFTVI